MGGARGGWIAALLALGFAPLVAACGPAEPPLSAVLITLDTTNRDALGCYGQRLPITPNLDRLAREALVFDQARTVAPLTLPAHGSMLTGLVPLRHGVRDNGLFPLAAEAETVAERLGAAGYACAAFVSAVVLAAPYGLDQGFGTYDAPRGRRSGASGHFLERPARETVRAACDWLRARDRARPFFLWVHGFEPHEPYAAPAEFLERAGGDPYLAEVAALDDALGELLRVLDQETGPERLLVIVAADHGEALGDHGERTHSVLCIERVLRVPLLVRLPGRARAGERVADPVSVTDIAPTLLAELGLEAPAGLDGRSLLASTRERGLYFESYTGYLNYGWGPLAGWVEGSAKYVHGTEPELYDVAGDPAERVNLFAERGAEVARARAGMAALAARPRLPRGGARGGGHLDEALAADVQALGYAGTAGGESEFPEPLADTGLPAPRTRMDELELFYRALVRHEKGKTPEAIADLESVVEQNPRNATALNVLASYLYQSRETARALAVLERIRERARERATVQDLMGHCLENLKRPAEALEHFERALALKPGDPHQLQDVERARRAAGE